MPDREKVIKALELCSDKTALFVCNQCPYDGTGEEGSCDMEQLCADALALLKEQEAVFKPHYIDEHGKHFICGVECSACHREISSTYHYCPYCGRSVKWE